MLHIHKTLANEIITKMIIQEKKENFFFIIHKNYEFNYLAAIDSIFSLGYNMEVKNTTTFLACTLLQRCFNLLPELNDPLNIPYCVIACVLISAKLEDPDEKNNYFKILYNAMHKTIEKHPYPIWIKAINNLEIECIKNNIDFRTKLKSITELYEFKIAKILNFKLIYVTPIVFSDYYLIQLFKLYKITDKKKFTFETLIYLAYFCYVTNEIIPLPSHQVVIVLCFLLKSRNFDYNGFLQKINKYYNYNIEFIDHYYELLKKIENNIKLLYN